MSVRIFILQVSSIFHYLNDDTIRFIQMHLIIRPRKIDQDEMQTLKYLIGKFFGIMQLT